MIGTLLKKQIREQFVFVNQGRKNKQRSKGAAVFLIVILVISYLSLMMAGFGISLLFSVLITAGQAWLFFAMTGMMGIAFGIFGNVFVTYHTLYKAKDNELLLAMPIRPWKILFVRMSTLYGAAVVFESVMMIPALVQYFIQKGFSVSVLLQGILVMLVTGFFILALSCILAFFVALIASRIRNKQVAITILTVALLGGYYYVYFQINGLLQKLLEQSAVIGNALQKYVFPLYALGRGSAGEWLYTLAYTGIIAALFGLVYFVLSKTFIRLATLTDKTARARNKTVKYEKQSLPAVLLKKEFAHLTGSAAYMLNGAFGTLVLVIGTVFLAIYAGKVREGLPNITSFSFFGTKVGDMLPVLLGTAAIFLSGLNNLAAPSISIEGKHFWILRTLPVPEKETLAAKLKMHLILTLPFTLLLAVVASFILDFAWYETVTAVCFTGSAVFFMAYYGMIMGLRFPIMTWDNEAVPVKTGAAVAITLFSSWGFAIIFAGLYLLNLLVFGGIIKPVLFTAVFAALFAAGALLLRRAVFTWGVRKLGEI